MSNVNSSRKPSNVEKLGGRGQTIGSVEDYLKRKRSDTEKEQDEAGIFEKSKRTVRSPNKTRADTLPVKNQEMDELKRLILSTSANLKKEIKNNFNQTAKINEDLKFLREEMRIREVEWRKEKELWNQEKNELMEKVKILQEKLEQQEKKTKETIYRVPT
ncbi:hypothetical protein QE152_g38322 [Popillia japonica]|uniref:Uncharacterized protein n=1 Tax=Popillia japonica TaxID=7064 RepID=A0AAW1I765_POPJA